MIKYYIARLLRAPRRFRMIYYICFNRLKFRLNDVKFGRNMQVYTKFFLNKAPGVKFQLVMILSILMVMPLIHFVAIFVGVCILHFHILKLR